MKVSRTWLGAATIVTLVLSACTAGDGGEASGGDTSELDSVRLQLQWVPQAQFGGYFAARYDRWSAFVDEKGIKPE